MLKIKDNIDLKELEKFGFEIEKDFKGNPYYTIEIEDLYYGDNYTQDISIDTKTREITIGIYGEAGNIDIKTKILSVIYDLILAGLVEKV